MEKLLENALAQFRKNGKIIITFYALADGENPQHIICDTFNDACEYIRNAYFDQWDDIHVSHPNAL